jgi:hypothetical protein
MAALVRDTGFEVIEQADQHDTAGPAGWNRDDALKPSRLSHLTHARIPRPAGKPGRRSRRS